MFRKLSSLLLLVLSVQFGVSAQSPDSLRVSILGDSYSTFEGWLSPRTNAIWYLKEGSEYGSRNNDVNRVEQTWWYQVIKGMGYKFEKNNSYSGATICFTGYKGADGRFRDYSDRAFVTRVNDLGHPDVILVCGGTNDSWAGVPMGVYKWRNWTNEDLHCFRPAMAKMFSDLKMLYPEARIVFLLNSELSDDVNDAVHTACRRYRIECVDLQDIDKQSSHPCRSGMTAIAEQTMAALRK